MTDVNRYRPLSFHSGRHHTRPGDLASTANAPAARALGCRCFGDNDRPVKRLGIMAGYRCNAVTRQ